MEPKILIIGAGLPNDARSEMQYFIKELAPNTLVHQIEKTDKSSPFKLIEFTNEKAVEWKVSKVLGVSNKGNS